MTRKGAAREVGSFSAGMIDCIVLCMRLALVDALFGEEKPFLILDDPFVNLDDKHTKRAREMLDKIAQNHHVICLDLQLKPTIILTYGKFYQSHIQIQLECGFHHNLSSQHK